jgi:cell division transport system permease protein
MIYLIEEMWWSIRANLTGFFMAMIAMACVLVLWGLFLLGYFNIERLLGRVREEVKIVMYLQEEITADQVNTLRERLKKETGVADAVYLSKKQALEEFRRIMPEAESLLTGLGENPLPASFEIKVSPEWQAAEPLSRLVQSIKQMKGVEEVQYGEKWVSALQRGFRLFEMFSWIVGIVLGLLLVIIIGTTLRLTAQIRKPDVEILQLIGANRLFIHLPFILEGALAGTAAGLLAVAALKGLYDFFGPQVAMSESLVLEFRPVFLPLVVIGILIAAGTVLGAVGGMISVRRLSKS